MRWNEKQKLKKNFSSFIQTLLELLLMELSICCCMKLFPFLSSQPSYNEHKQHKKRTKKLWKKFSTAFHNVCMLHCNVWQSRSVCSHCFFSDNHSRWNYCGFMGVFNNFLKLKSYEVWYCMMRMENVRNLS